MRRFILFGVVVVGFGASVFLLVRRSGESATPPVERQRALALGFGLGAAVSRDVPGGQVVVVDYPRLDAMLALAEARVAGLVRALEPARYQVVRVPVDDLVLACELGARGEPLMEGNFTLQAYTRMMMEYPDAVAVVSFIGIPEGLNGVSRKGGLPPLYANSALAEQGMSSPLVRAIAKPRAEIWRPEWAPTGTIEQWFTQGYDLIRHEN
ncbi:MAG TPA: hypothetical protein PKE12_05415 [Kiritimatiellia bacterium]|nr:hypothetical protein [Kiritimatiellia bacterium]